MIINFTVKSDHDHWSAVATIMSHLVRNNCSEVFRIDPQSLMQPNISILAERTQNPTDDKSICLVASAGPSPRLCHPATSPSVLSMLQIDSSLVSTPTGLRSPSTPSSVLIMSLEQVVSSPTSSPMSSSPMSSPMSSPSPARAGFKKKSLSHPHLSPVRSSEASKNQIDFAKKTSKYFAEEPSEFSFKRRGKGKGVFISADGAGGGDSFIQKKKKEAERARRQKEAAALAHERLQRAIITVQCAVRRRQARDRLNAMGKAMAARTSEQVLIERATAWLEDRRSSSTPGYSSTAGITKQAAERERARVLARREERRREELLAEAALSYRRLMAYHRLARDADLEEASDLGVHSFRGVHPARAVMAIACSAPTPDTFSPLEESESSNAADDGQSKPSLLVQARGSDRQSPRPLATLVACTQQMIRKARFSKEKYTC